MNLDAILSATESRMNGNGRTISENHDINSINGLAGLSDPGEMIGCGMYQELRRHADETDQAYYARLQPLIAALPANHRDKILAAINGAAIKRAALDTSNGRVNVMVAGAEALKAHWHKLGVAVSEAVNSADAQRLAGLTFRVEKAQQVFQGIDGQPVKAEGQFALYRTDTGAYLGSVGSRYSIIQNTDAFGFLDTLVGEFGAKYETAGSVFGGKRVWMQISLPQQAFEVVPGDVVYATALFTNPHDGSGMAWCLPTSQRAVCNNTLRIATKDKTKGIGLRHTGNISNRIADARQALGLAVQGFERAKEEAQVLVHTPAHADAYFGNVLDAILDVTAAQAKVGAAGLAGADLLAGIISGAEASDRAEKEYRRAIEYRTTVLEDIVSRYESERCGISGIRGSAWSVYNAISESADHGRLGSPLRRVGNEQDRASRQFESALIGDVDGYKQVAYAQALALAAN